MLKSTNKNGHSVITINNKPPAELPNKTQEDIQFSNLTTDIKAFYVTNDELR